MRATEIEVCPVKGECIYFTKLSGDLKIKNRVARTAALNGKEIAGMHNTMCGNCTILERNTRPSDEKIKALKTLIETHLHEQT